MKDFKNVEPQIREIAGEIYELIGEEAPSVFQTKRWLGKIMEWAIKDEDFKIRLLRFIDVLPALKNDRLVAKVLREYFGEGGAPALISHSVKAISMARLLPSVAAKAIRTAVSTIARQFMAGARPEDAYGAFLDLRSEGIACSIDILGEEVLSEKEARDYINRYSELLDYAGQRVAALSDDPTLDFDQFGRIPRLDISLKATAFYSQLDPIDREGSVEQTVSRMSPLVKKAQELGCSITLDMEQYYLKDLTLEIFQRLAEAHKDFGFVGVVLQAYLKESPDDLRKMLRWADGQTYRPLIRLVKGAYWDYETVVNRRAGWPVPVFTQKAETDASYERMTVDLLVNVDKVRPAIGTHNIRSIANAIAVSRILGLPKHAFEFQMIYGMAEPVRAAVRKMGYRVRAYTPIGELIPGMGYLIRRLLENTYDDSFLRRAFYERAPFDEVIKKPEPSAETPTGPEADFWNEPGADFSKAESKDAMTAALKKVRSGFGEKYPLLIAAKDIFTDRVIPSINPAKPTEVVGTVCQADAEIADEALKNAKDALNSWRRLSAEKRAEFLFKAAENFRSERFELAALEVLEVGKAWKDADGDITEAIDYPQYYGREAVRMASPKMLGNYPGEKNEYLYEPRGIGLVISPWNFPIAIPVGMISASLVTGNCVIFKPSGLSPICGRKLIDCFKKAGLPAGVLQFVPGPGAEVGEYLVKSRDIDFIAFTGSKEVGLRIIELVGWTPPDARSIKRVVAEMGGKNAIIVDETADLDEAVRGVLESAVGFQGQKCSACSRVIVVGDIADEFGARLKEAMNSLKIGPPEDPGSVMGPVIDKAALEKVQRYVNLGLEEGEPLLNRQVDMEGFFVGPTILKNLPEESPVVREEIFGPVVVMVQAKDFEGAIRIANDSLYALTGGIFSRSPENIRKAKTELRVGNLYINRKITGALVGRQPFGGFGMSGVGSKAGGPDYLLQFVNARSISENTLRRGFAPKSGYED
jgi:RHH-type transcriptional regulator, proline utilization regulon repressor / proline dehydrogenase / delta 1-pyrroline-5-carboxylate dehydrogenase